MSLNVPKAFSLTLPLLLFAMAIANAEEVTIAAPIGLKTILTEISHFVEQKNPGWKVNEIYDNSSDIVDRVRGGTPIDLLIIDEVNLTEIKEFAELQSEQRLFQNDAVIVAKEDTDLIWDDVKKEAAEDPQKMKKIALLGESTILGKLSRDYLKKVGITKLEDEKLVEVKNPRGALEAIKNEEAKLAIVFASDASQSKKLKVLARLPSSDFPGQVYYCAILKQAGHKKPAELYLKTFGSSIVQQILQNSGFTLSPKPVK